MRKPLRVGIPRAILFYKYYERWKSLLNALGFDVITSPMTTQEILKDGIRHGVGDLCLSVKSFLGHVYHLKDTVDCLFIPRYVSVEKDAYMCPKILGLPDMVKAVFPNLPKILSPKLNVKEGIEKTIDEFTMTIARFFSLRHKDVKAVYLRTQNITECSAFSVQHSAFSEKLRTQNLNPPTPPFTKGGLRGDYAKEGYIGITDSLLATTRLSSPKSHHSSLNIGIVGRPYIVLDDCLNKGIVRQLRHLGINLVYIEPTPQEIEDVMKKLPKWVYWSFGKEVVTAAYLFLNSNPPTPPFTKGGLRGDSTKRGHDNRTVDGVINIVNATCGPDSFTGEVIKRFLKETNKPYMTILVDEHTSDMGIQTRIEAFTDMIMRVSV